MILTTDTPLTDIPPLRQLYAERAALAFQVEHGTGNRASLLLAYERLQGKHTTQLDQRHERWDGGEIAAMVRELGGYLNTQWQREPHS